MTPSRCPAGSSGDAAPPGARTGAPVRVKPAAPAQLTTRPDRSYEQAHHVRERRVTGNDERKASMLRNIGIRWKVLAVLVLPVLVLAATGGVATGSMLDRAQAAEQAKVVSDAGELLDGARTALDAERLSSVQALRGDPSAIESLPETRARTDSALLALNAALAWSPPAWLPALPGSSTAVRTAVDALTEASALLDQARTDTDVVLDTGESVATEKDVLAAFDTATDTVTQLPAQVAAQVTDRSLAPQLEALSATARAAEGMSRMQLAGLDVLRGGADADLARQDLAVAAAEVDAAYADLRAVGTDTQVRSLTEMLDTETAVELDNQRAALADGTSARLPSVPQWRQVTSAQQEQVRALNGRVAAQASARAAQAADTAWLRTAVALGLAVALVGASVLFALMVSRRITERLRRLTRSASGLAVDLPDVVGRVAAGQPVPAEPDDVPHGRDEVGRLAAAFREAHATTLRVAHEQAQLRASVAETFVTVARRNQVLLSRQLSFIDQLERTEEDPDTLQELFRLDHLATRMRRNAESLLVLAGVDSGRRLRATMPLSDVVRTAVSEIEHYERVAVRLAADPPVASHLALGLAHLVAELVENATVFSEPGSPVMVSSAALPTGVRLSVHDQGIGLGEEEIAAANERLAASGQAELMGAQRLGFFVVATLAARLGAQVRLRRGDPGGTVAEIDLGPVLFADTTELDARAGTPVAAPAHPEPAEPLVPQDIVPPDIVPPSPPVPAVPLAGASTVPPPFPGVHADFPPVGAPGDPGSAPIAVPDFAAAPAAPDGQSPDHAAPEAPQVDPAAGS
ncbi:MAG: nitrate- and nitrite sensing domain-containing protein, partial [Kineosporiaceae bacterium]